MKQKITFPKLRELMGKYSLYLSDMGDVIGHNYVTFRRKLDNETDFNLTEILQIRDFFIAKGENPETLTLESLFFAWITHNSD